MTKHSCMNNYWNWYPKADTSIRWKAKHQIPIRFIWLHYMLFPGSCLLCGDKKHSNKDVILVSYAYRQDETPSSLKWITILSLKTVMIGTRTRWVLSTCMRSGNVGSPQSIAVGKLDNHLCSTILNGAYLFCGLKEALSHKLYCVKQIYC